MLFNITVFQSGYDFRAAISVIFRSSFADLVALHDMESTDDDEEEEDDDLSSNEEEHVMQLTQEQWRDVFGTLNDLGALSSFEDCFADTLVEHIEKKVRKTATGKFEVQKLKSLEAWLGAVREGADSRIGARTQTDFTHGPVESGGSNTTAQATMRLCSPRMGRGVRRSLPASLASSSRGSRRRAVPVLFSSPASYYL